MKQHCELESNLSYALASLERSGCNFYHSTVWFVYSVISSEAAWTVTSYNNIICTVITVVRKVQDTRMTLPEV